jgi:hypothetical protein
MQLLWFLQGRGMRLLRQLLIGFPARESAVSGAFPHTTGTSRRG